MRARFRSDRVTSDAYIQELRPASSGTPKLKRFQTVASGAKGAFAEFKKEEEKGRAQTKYASDEVRSSLPCFVLDEEADLGGGIASSLRRALALKPVCIFGASRTSNLLKSCPRITAR